MRLAVVSLVVAVVAALGAGCASDDASVADFAEVERIGWVLSAGIDVEGWDRVPDLSFENGGIDGSTGCNAYIASYSVDGSVLDLELGNMTGLTCPPPGGDVEAAFVAALERVEGWAVEDDELVLLDGSSEELLRFERRLQS